MLSLQFTFRQFVSSRIFTNEEKENGNLLILNVSFC